MSTEKCPTDFTNVHIQETELSLKNVVQKLTELALEYLLIL
jgi:hypothetical protein